MPKIPARCKTCNSRRNLSKRPELYVRWPTCHQPGCDGKMRVDEYRLRKGEKDHPPMCYLDCYPYPHRVDSPNCRCREDWVLDRSLKPRSKHCPHKYETNAEAPF